MPEDAPIVTDLHVTGCILVGEAKTEVIKLFVFAQILCVGLCLTSGPL